LKLSFGNDNEPCRQAKENEHEQNRD